MIYKILTNDLFFQLSVEHGIKFLYSLDFTSTSKDDFNIKDNDIIVIKNYFEDKDVYDYIEDYVIKKSLYITYLPRLNNESYALVTNSLNVYNKFNSYLKLYKKKILLIYDFPHYWDIQWKSTIMCERMCEKMMNDTCVTLFDSTVFPLDFITDMNWNIRNENLNLIKNEIEHADKIVCSIAVTKLLKKLKIDINPNKIILHPHVWGTNINYHIDNIEKDFGYRVPYKNMCYMSNVQEISKKENSFIGFYICENNNFSDKNKDILLWGKDINFVIGNEFVDEKIKLIDDLCEKYTVYTTVNDDDDFKKIKKLLVNNHNFINYGILNRSDYLNEMKSFKIFLSINEKVYESLGFIEALAAGCHIISHDNFHLSITKSEDEDIKKHYSIYEDILHIKKIVQTVLSDNFYQSKTLDIYTKFKYVNRVINIINDKHETEGSVYF
jgi:nitrogen regulatory protein PII-like uncharacterized protein